jgi:precorrin-2 dehydrogenase/sirohydrochlorin ferrochelatase
MSESSRHESKSESESEPERGTDSDIGSDSGIGIGVAEMRQQPRDGLDLPIALRLARRSVLLVGGGKIAEARLRQLLEVGAIVHVVSPEVTEEIRAHAQAKRIRLSERRYQAGDAQGAFVIFAATSSDEVNRAVVGEAYTRGVLVHVADEPALCDFTMPAFGRRGPVTVAVSTGGASPALARAARDRALAAIGPEFGVLARLLRRLRRNTPRGPERASRLQAIVDADAATLLARGQRRLLFGFIRTLWPPSATNKTSNQRMQSEEAR